MSLETRSNSALFKRAEQLKRWEDSDTNREPVSPKQKSRRIKFSSGCVFLAACAAGDKDEVLKLLEKGADINTANVDGLTALHQACIDDNLDMVEFLVQHGADANRGDNEGWTPLHATASCGFLYIAKYLIEKGADVAAVNNDGELAIDIAECTKMEDLLKDEINKRGIDCEAARSEEERLMLKDAKEWMTTKSSLVETPHPKTGATPLHVASAKGYTEVMKILLLCGADVDAQDVDGWTPLHAAAHWGQKEASQLLAENLADMEAKNFVGQTPFDLSDSEMFRFLDDLKKKQNKEDIVNRRQSKKRTEIEDRPVVAEIPSKVKKVELEITSDEDKNVSNSIERKNRVNSTIIESHIPHKNLDATIILEDTSHHIDDGGGTGDTSQVWRKPLSKQVELENHVKSTESRIISSSPTIDDSVILRRANNLQTNENTTKDEMKDVRRNSTTRSEPPLTTPPVNGSQSNVQPVRRSFVPPVRDEESETQRKAHAKRVRETRRSTQGVTLEEIKSAEQFVKMQNESKNNDQPAPNGNSSNGITVTATITTASPTIVTRDSEEPIVTHERRPSWRLKVDNGSSKFKLEDATKIDSPSTPSFIRRTSTLNNNRPSSANLETAETTVTIPLRRPKSFEEKDHDKENDARNAQATLAPQATLATQAAIQRRRRPKRRSTGVVSFDNVDDLEQEKDPSAGSDHNDPSITNTTESGNDRGSRTRFSSSSDIHNENGEIDYKKLYEQSVIENEKLKEKLKKSDEELRETKQTLEKINLVTSKNSLSELEKRERRAMERKLSEMEEELKQLQKLKAENERLKADNRSLTRVINKLTNSPKK